MEIPFTKYHALGNDFLVIQLPKNPGRKHWKTARLMCDRHTGVGADGIVCLSPSKESDHRIDIYNADGGWAEQSGNGLRIAGVWASWNDKRQSSLKFQTPAGVAQVQLHTPPGDETLVSAVIGEPDFRVASLPMKYSRNRCINGKVRIGNQSVTMICLAVGNPHAVVPVDQFDFDWKTLGSAIERSPIFPRGTNVEFVRVQSRKRIEVTEWERGVGPTGSSGTGAAAVVAAMVVTGRTGRICTVQFPAGSLEVEWQELSNCIRLTGPVTYVMRGLFRAL
jgi:diaminopimelate epimerase